MCGITGILHLDGVTPVDASALHAMNERLFHRGPDDAGLFTEGPVGLAMRRLSIIDLSSGRQPIRNEDGSVTIVFNGEIYTYRELAKQLAARGHRFATHSDTEVIVHLFEDHGAKCVDHLRGMFAFAIWDARRRTLLLARDRLGIKPLYYGVFDRQLVFGSELKALLANPVVRCDLDARALSAYLRYGYVAEPLTIWKGIRKLPPGHVLEVRDGRLAESCYWNVDAHLAAPPNVAPEAELVRELDERLREVVKLRLVSDVPVGAFLSGGLDSSTVVALMARELGHPVKTFSIGFAEAAFDERPSARAVAERYGTEHTELVLEPESVDVLTTIAASFDEPFGDPSALPTYFVSKLARQSVKVVLSGDGGDEVFGGYDRYLAHLRRRYVERVPEALRRFALRPLADALPANAPGKRFLYNASLAGDERYLDSVSYFPLRVQRRLLEPALWASAVGEPPATRRNDGFARDVDPLSRIQAIDFHGYLSGDILTKVDRMSMAHSIEARVPLLDHELVAWAARLPSRSKIRDGVGKVLLRRVAERYLPPSILERKKQGFAVPLHAWFRDDVGGFLREILTESNARTREYFRPAAVAELLEHERHASRPSQLWMLAMLELWHRAVER